MNHFKKAAVLLSSYLTLAGTFAFVPVNYSQFNIGYLASFTYGNARGTSANTTASCIQVVAKIDQKVSEYQTLKSNRLARYDAFKARVRETAQRRGISSATVEADLATLDGKVNTLMSSVDALVAKWNAQKAGIDCNNPQSDANKQIINGLKTDLNAIQTQISDIRSFIRSRISYYKGSVLL
jgi:hypothetical protein